MRNCGNAEIAGMPNFFETQSTKSANFAIRNLAIPQFFRYTTFALLSGAESWLAEFIAKSKGGDFNERERFST
jgi:hypothetical protein